MHFPEAFLRNIDDLPGCDGPSLAEALAGESVVSVRWNPFKIEAPAPTIGGCPAATPVPWNRYGRYLDKRPYFTFDPLFHSGVYYPQEASSMFVEHIFRSVADQGVTMLDMCAAPGGKSTLYSTLAGPEGVVVANEPVRARALTLSDNVRKWGIGNVIVTNNDPTHFSGLREWFDVVAVDAPCSGEGMFRKDRGAVAQWSEENVKMSAARQQRILAQAWDTLKPGGVLIYSTCTFNRLENEDNISWLSDNYDCSDPGIQIDPSWNIARSEAGGIGCFRFFPHMLRGEGFFVAALRKGGQRGRLYRPKPRKELIQDVSRAELRELSAWVNQPEYMRMSRIGQNYYGYYNARFEDIKTIAENLNTLYAGICMGQIYGGKLKPDHALALFHDLAGEAAHAAPLDLDQAIRYLKKEEVPEAIEQFSEGLNLVTFDVYPIGWAKRISSRINNLYPKPLMILSKENRAGK